jgi:hypothetical protein
MQPKASPKERPQTDPNPVIPCPSVKAPRFCLLLGGFSSSALRLLDQGAPARFVLSMASHDVTNNVIVSMEPLVIQMYGDPAIRIIDLELITADELKASLTGSGVDTLLWLKENNYETDADRECYGNQFAHLNSLPAHVLVTAKDFSVIRVGPP